MARARDFGVVLHRFQQADRIVAAHDLAAGVADQAAERIRRGRAIQRDQGAGSRECGELGRQRVGLPDLGGLFEVVARYVRQLAVIDEYGRPAVLGYQRIGQRQRGMGDVGAADVEGPGHRVRIRQHERVDAELVDLLPNAPELIGLGFAGKARVVHRDRCQRRRRALGPDRVHRVGLDRDQFGAGLGADRGQSLGGGRRMQPRVEPEAVAYL